MEILIYQGSSMGQDNTVGTATFYRLDSPGTESQWRQNFLYVSMKSLGPIHPPVQWVLVLIPGGKATGLWSQLLTPS